MAQRPDDVTRIALDTAREAVLLAAAPWKIPPKVLDGLLDRLIADFMREVNDYRKWKFWQPKIDRLGKYVGVMAAYLAELEKGFQLRPGSITEAQLQTAFLIVKACCPTTDSPVPKGGLCRDGLAAVKSRATDIRKTMLGWVPAKSR